MDLNEDERLSNFTLKTKIKVKEQSFLLFYISQSLSSLQRLE